MFRKKFDGSLSLGRIAWKRILVHPPAMAGLAVICLATAVAVMGYLITPDQSPFCNQQFIELATRKPGFRVHVLEIRKNEAERRVGLFRKMISGRISPYIPVPVNRVDFEGSLLMIEEFDDLGVGNLFTRKISIAEVVYPIDPGTEVITEGDEVRFALYDGTPMQASVSELQKRIMTGQLKERRFLLGTDRFGRDLFSRLILGTRVSLSVGFISVLISLIIGISLGALAGYYRGFTDRLIMWLINVVWSVPTLLMVIAITLVLGRGFWQIFIAVGLTMWVEVARVVRGQVLGIREKEYVEAARALGFSHFRILFRHIMPNAFSPVIIISAANFASAILIEAGLSFLGIGVQPPIPSWGTMIKDHYGYIIVDQAYLAVLPGLAIMVMVLSFTMLGNGLRDALDTRIAVGGGL